MIYSIEVLRDYLDTYGGIIKNDAVAWYILDNSEGSFYLLSANRCLFLHLSFKAKSPFPAEPRHSTNSVYYTSFFKKPKFFYEPTMQSLKSLTNNVKWKYNQLSINWFF